MAEELLKSYERKIDNQIMQSFVGLVSKECFQRYDLLYSLLFVYPIKVCHKTKIKIGQDRKILHYQVHR